MRILLLLVLSVLLLSPLELQARINRSHQPQTFQAFWLKFKAAVAKNDKEAVAAMTRLPFLFDSEELDQAGFVKRYNEIISRRDKRCFTRARPVKDQDSYSVFCGQEIFSFARFDGEWKFSGIGPND